MLKTYNKHEREFLYRFIEDTEGEHGKEKVRIYRMLTKYKNAATRCKSKNKKAKLNRKVAQLQRRYDEITRYVPDAAIKYQCSKCGATNCKLWRQYNTFLNHIELLCCNCAEEDQNKVCGLDREKVKEALKDPTLDETDRMFLRHGSDQIGWLIPAVPTADGCETFWGYTSVPGDGVRWWKKLPLRPVA